MDKKSFIINAYGFGGHLAKDPRRLVLLGYLEDLLESQEVRARFMQWPDKANGKRGNVELRWNLICAVDDPEIDAILLTLKNNGQG